MSVFQRMSSSDAQDRLFSDDEGLPVAAGSEGCSSWQDVYMNPSTDDTRSASLSWENICYSVREQNPNGQQTSKQLLQDSSGHVSAGSLAAIMGPSGSGKSTLLQILAGKRIGSYSGTVYLNGRDISSEHLRQRVVAYVPQDDLMPAHWTPREAVTFSWRLKNPVPRHATVKDIKVVIDKLLKDLRLENASDTKVGSIQVAGLSGGERRRLALARGIAARPYLLCCDEPTSGLSAADALSCVKFLEKHAADWGTTVVMVIHQPRHDIAEKFQELIMLTTGGRTVYSGRMSDAAEHWAAAEQGVPPTCKNPADHYLDTVTPGHDEGDPAALLKAFVDAQWPQVKSNLTREVSNPRKSVSELLRDERQHLLGTCTGFPPKKNSLFVADFGLQCKLLLARKLRLALIDKDVIFTNILMQVLMGLALGFMYVGVGDREPAGIAQLGFFFIFLNVSAIIPQFTMPALIQERDMMKVEASEALYHELAYIITSSAVNIGLSFIGFSLMVVLLFAFAHLPLFALPVVYFWSVLCFLTFDSLIGACAAVAKNAEQANAAYLPFQATLCMFNGVILTRKSAPPYLAWILDIAPFSLSMESIQYRVYGDDAQAWNRLVELQGFEQPNDFVGIGVCMSIVVVSRCIQVWALKSMHRVLV